MIYMTRVSNNQKWLVIMHSLQDSW